MRRAPQVSRSLRLPTPSACRGAPARRLLSSRPFPFRRLRAPSSSPAGLLLTNRVCLPGAALCHRAVSPTRVTIIGGRRQGCDTWGTPLRLNFLRELTPSGETDLNASYPRSPNPTRVYFSKVVCTQSDPGEAAAGRLWAELGAHKGEEVSQGPRAPPSRCWGLELNWSLQEPHPTSGLLYVAVGAPHRGPAVGKPEQVAQPLGVQCGEPGEGARFAEPGG